MSIPEVIVDYHVEQKTWGWETWIVNNDLYCGKILHVLPGKHTSLHFHMQKHETMYCLKGSFRIAFVDTKTGDWDERILGEGDSIVITPGQPHEIWGGNTLNGAPNQLIEFSTHHENADSFRVGKPSAK